MTTSLEVDVGLALGTLRARLAEAELSRREIRGLVFELGLAWPHFPVGAGGMGLGPEESAAVALQLEALGLPATQPASVIAVGMAAPTLVAHGSESHRDLLRAIYLEDAIWCQLFSEPGAGSDLANVSTSARREGDEWVVDGAKVWTSLAHEAEWGLLLTRTNPDAPKHRGMTFFIVRLDTPGIDVRPLFQITGDAEFNEIHLDGVRIPDAQRLGPVDGGWSVALATLSSERSALSSVERAEVRAIDSVVAAWRDRKERPDILRARLAALMVRDRLVTATRWRTSSDPQLGPVNKLMWSELDKAVAEMGLDVLGAEVHRFEAGYPMVRRSLHDVAVTEGADPHARYLRSRANTIEGGTSEILRNLVGERLLGLEPEPRVDKQVPWRESRRG